MKRLLSIVFGFCLLLRPALADVSFLPATNEVNLSSECASYDTSPQIVWISAMATYVSGMYPQYTNHIWPVLSHSGSGLQGDFENDEGAKLMPFMHAMDTNVTAWNYSYAAGDNGGYTSNQVVQWSTNIWKGPQLVWNGFALTNEGLTFPQVIHLPIGAVPGDSSTGGSGSADVRNNAATNLAGVNGLVVIDMWHDLWTNGVNTDVVGARLFGFNPGGHPYWSGYLCMALKNLIALHAETNIGSCTLDFRAAVARSTNHMVISGVQLSGNTLTFTDRCDRIPPGWRVGAGTNGCDDAFALMPQLASSFQWPIQVTNMPAGNYLISIDNSNITTLTDVQLAAGWNMFAVTNGPLWAARMAVWNAKLDQMGLDHATYQPTHDAGSTGVGGNRDLINYMSNAAAYPATSRGTNFITTMDPAVSGMKALDVLIHDAAQQTNHTITISQIVPRYLGARYAQ